MPTPTEIARDALAKAALLDKDVSLFRDEIAKLELIKLRDGVAKLETQVEQLMKAKEEADKRPWQFIYIGAAAAMALVGGLVSAVIQYAFRKS